MSRRSQISPQLLRPNSGMLSVAGLKSAVVVGGQSRWTGFTGVDWLRRQVLRHGWGVVFGDEEDPIVSSMDVVDIETGVGAASMEATRTEPVSRLLRWIPDCWNPMRRMLLSCILTYFHARSNILEEQ